MTATAPLTASRVQIRASAMHGGQCGEMTTTTATGDCVISLDGEGTITVPASDLLVLGTGGFVANRQSGRSEYEESLNRAGVWV